MKRTVQKINLVVGIFMLVGMANFVVANTAPTPAEIVVTEVVLAPLPPTKQEVVAVGVMRNIQLLQKHLTAEQEKWFADKIAEASVLMQVPDSYIVTIISAESDFIITAESHKDAVGAMQVIPAQHPDSPYDATDPEDNILAGAYVLSKYYRQCGENWTCAIRSYNIGIGAHKRGQNVAAADRYMKKIKARLKKLT